MVHLMRHKSNSELLKYIRDHPYLYKRQPRRKTSVVYRSPAWRLHDRLTDIDVNELITAFKTGIAKHVLAERYGINVKSVKKLLRRHGVKRKTRWDMQNNQAV